MEERELEDLLKRYREGSCTQEEIRQLESWYAQWNMKTYPPLTDVDLLEAEKLMKPNVSHVKSTAKMRPLYYRAAAAVALLVLSTGIFFYLHKHDRQFQRGVATHKEDVQPGSSKAILTLSNGTKITLDSARRGVLASQGNSKIVKLNNGLLSYKPSNSLTKGTGYQHRFSTGITYNTLVTPRGGQFRLILPDGSKVWLNAASSLRYPTAFTNGNREVEVSGEAYFEIAAKAASPFIVKAGSTRIQVLGTHFNIEAYSDENSIRTTLSEGSVRILTADQNRILKPGEQAAVTKGTKDISIQQVNLDEVLAWKNGLFYFDDTKLEAIMRKVARWYDVTVIYQAKDLANKNYSGVLSRYGNVDALLKRLELTGTVHFQVNNRTIIVSD